MQGMEPHETLAIILAFMSTYALFMTPLGREVWGELGVLVGYAVIAVLCLTSVVWLTIIGILREGP